MLRTGCERSVITYSALISACEKAGQWQMALNLFSEMLKEKCEPNVITYNSLITACAQVGAQGLLTQYNRPGARGHPVQHHNLHLASTLHAGCDAFCWQDRTSDVS